MVSKASKAIAMAVVTVMVMPFSVSVHGEVQRGPDVDQGHFETYYELLAQLRRDTQDTDLNIAIYRENPGDELLYGETLEEGNLRGDLGPPDDGTTCPSATREGVSLVWMDVAPSCPDICGFPIAYKSKTQCEAEGTSACACPDGLVLDIQGWVCITQTECDKISASAPTMAEKCSSDYNILSIQEQVQCCQQLNICQDTPKCPKGLAWSSCITCPKTCGAKERLLCAAVCRAGCACESKSMFMDFGMDGSVTCVAEQECPQHRLNIEVENIGGHVDEYGCFTSAGYVWCKQTESCVQPSTLVGGFIDTCEIVASNSRGYNCKPTDMPEWSANKQKFCCDHENVGCDITTLIKSTPTQCYSGTEPSEAFGKSFQKVSIDGGDFTKDVWKKVSHSSDEECAALCFSDQKCKGYEFIAQRALCIALENVPSLDAPANWKEKNDVFTKLKLPSCTDSDNGAPPKITSSDDMDCEEVTTPFLHFDLAQARRVKRSKKVRISLTKVASGASCAELCITEGDTCTSFQFSRVSSSVYKCELLSSTETLDTKPNKKWRLHHKTVFCTESVEEQPETIPVCPVTELGYFELAQKSRLSGSKKYTTANTEGRAATSIQECAVACKNIATCAAFEFHRKKMRCELKEISRIDNPKVVFTQRWDHYRRTIFECESAEDAMNRLLFGDPDIEEEDPEMRPSNRVVQKVFTQVKKGRVEGKN